MIQEFDTINFSLPEFNIYPFGSASKMPTYIFDFAVERADIRPDIGKIPGYVWTQFLIDGYQQTICTPKVPLGDFAIWNYRARLTMNIADIKRCFISCHLCVEYQTRRKEIVAHSKIPMSCFPSSPKKYNIPLLRQTDNSTRVANICIQASLSECQFQGPFTSPQPPHGGFSHFNPQQGPMTSQFTGPPRYFNQ